MSNQSFTRRLEHLESQISEAASLIEQYEKILLFESDPRGRHKCITNIEQLRDQVTGYRNEYDRLRKNATATDSSSVSKRIKAKLDELREGQDKIKAGVDALLPYYEMGQRAIIAELAKHFNQSEFADTRKILSAIETNLLAESTLRQLIDSVQQALAQLRDHSNPLPQRDKIEEDLADVSLDIKHKVQLTIPLIPILLRYEGEIDLAKLRQRWDALRNRVGEREPLSHRFRKLITLAIAFLAVLIAGSYIYIRHRQNVLKPTDSQIVEHPNPTPAQTATLPAVSPSAASTMPRQTAQTLPSVTPTITRERQKIEPPATPTPTVTSPMTMPPPKLIADWVRSAYTKGRLMSHVLPAQ